MKQWLTRTLATLGLLGACALPAWAGYDESTDVQRANADPSPAKADSNINNYINQDEQINITPADGVVKVLRTDQKIMLNDFVTVVFPLKNATPRELRTVFRTVAGIEGGRAEAIQDKVGKQAFLQIMAPRYMIPYLRDAVAALDVPWLKEYWDGAQDTYYKAQNRDAAAVDKIASKYGGDDGFSFIDTTNNAVRHYDEEAYRTGNYLKGAALVDIPANQVLLDVKMYEVNTNNDTKLGLDYINWKNGPGRNLWSFIVSGYRADQWAKGLTSVFDPFIDARAPVPGSDSAHVLDTAAVEKFRAVNYILTSNYVDFLQAKGNAKVIASQKLLVASSKKGTISTDQKLLAVVNNSNELDTVGNALPTALVRNNNGKFFIDTNGNGNQDPGENELQVVTPDVASAPATVRIEDSKRALNYKNVGSASTSLTVTPYVGLESMELVLDLQIGDLAGLSPSGLPIINTRTVSSTVRLLDGQPYVIAGIKRAHKGNQTAKVPLLGSIPGLGYLFGGETNLKREVNLVITITPHFILASQKNVAPVPQVETLKAIVGGKQPLPLPKNEPGYDQWLFKS